MAVSKSEIATHLSGARNDKGGKEFVEFLGFLGLLGFVEIRGDSLR